MRTIARVAAFAAGLSIVGVVQAGSIDLGVTFRDFRDTHPDFEGVIGGLQPGQVASTLGADGLPVWQGPAKPGFTNEANFNQWYRDVPGVNTRIDSSLTFTETAPGSGIFAFGDSSFFPLDGIGFGNQGRAHNFHFTMQLSTTFTYTGGETFSFTGDDDLYVFINDELVIDLGGVHGAVNGSVDLDTLGLTPGENYSFDLFFAERHTTQSNFFAETSIVFDNNNGGVVIPLPSASMLGLAGVGAVSILRRR